MNIPRVILPFFSILLFFLSSSYLASSSENCMEAYICSVGKPVIEFPFEIQKKGPESFSYPGLELSCDKTTQTILTLPYSGQFAFPRIDYAEQEIWINDPNKCLAQRIFSLNLLGSPFYGVTNESLTFFNCSLDYLKYPLNPIACMSGSTYTVFATTSPRVINYLASTSTCNRIGTFVVPVEFQLYEEFMESDLTSHLGLAWDRPGCGSCATHGGRCGVKSNSSHQVVCSRLPQRGIPRSVRYAIIVGVLECQESCAFWGVLCCVFGKVSLSQGGAELFLCLISQWLRSPPSSEASISQGSRAYPKIVLSESRRLPKPNDSMCPICLSAYRPKETLKTVDPQMPTLLPCRLHRCMASNECYLP